MATGTIRQPASIVERHQSVGSGSRGCTGGRHDAFRLAVSDRGTEQDTDPAAAHAAVAYGLAEFLLREVAHAVCGSRTAEPDTDRVCTVLNGCDHGLG